MDNELAHEAFMEKLRKLVDTARLTPEQGLEMAMPFLHMVSYADQMSDMGESMRGLLETKIQIYERRLKALKTILGLFAPEFS